MQDLSPPEAPAVQSRVQLIHGDCLEVMPTLEAGAAQMCFADMPYTCTNMTWDTPIDLALFWQLAQRACAKLAPILCTATQPFTTRLINSNARLFRYDLIWAKQRGTGHLSANKRPMRSHEHILVFGKSGGTYNPQKTTGHVPIRSCGKNAPVNKFYGSRLVSSRVGQTERHPLSVLAIKSDNHKRGSARTVDLYHPTQKPVALLEWLIRTYTHEGDTILDPCAGSGTAAIAAMRTGRHAICIEKDEAYFEVMQTRVADEQAKLRDTTPVPEGVA